MNIKNKYRGNKNQNSKFKIQKYGDGMEIPEIQIFYTHTLAEFFKPSIFSFNISFDFSSLLNALGSILESLFVS